MRRVLSGMAMGVVATLTRTGVAYAATGGTLVLGRSNTASSQTVMTNSGTGPVLALSTRAGQVPLAVSAAAGKATNLNADRLDGLDGAALQRRVTGTCDARQAVSGVDATGGVSCTPTGDQATVTRAAAMAGGVGSVNCPAGTLPVGGGALPDPNSGAAVLLWSSPFISADGTQGGWFARAAAFEGSAYNGGGAVTVFCSANVDASNRG